MKHFWNKIRSIETIYTHQSLLLLFAFCMVFGSLVYYAYKITPFLSWIILLCSLLGVYLFQKYTHQKPTVPKEKNEKVFSWGLVVTGVDLILLLILFRSQTTDLAASPWTQMGLTFFVLYALATGLLFWNYHTNTSLRQNIFFTSMHFFVGLSIAAILYPLGYGFDAFIHRATENWIQLHGFISPKQPYYIGQYSLVVLLSNITHLKVFFIDVWLVPFFTAIFFPNILIKSLKKIIPSNFLSCISFWLLTFVPFLLLPLTTPHNLVLFLSIILVFLNFSLIFQKDSFLYPFFLALAAIFTHPLVGAPIFIFTCVCISIKKLEKHKKITSTILALTPTLFCFLLPIMFTLNGLRIGKPLPHFDNPFTHISTFFTLFKRPHWYASTSPLRFEILYFCERLIVPTFIVLSLVGFILLYKKQKSKLLWLFPLSALGLFIDAWLLRSWIVFPDVVAYEQGDYPLRLIYTSAIFLLPFGMYGFSFFLNWLKEKFKTKNIFYAVLFVILSVTLTITLYLSYPQRNVKVRFPGYNVTAAHFHATEWIHKQNTQYDYIVLSDQLVSAAALTNYSFAKYFQTPRGELFYYSIPTGGELYKYYGKMIYEGQKREYMEEAMKIVGVQKAYFVVNPYWANSNSIIEGAKRTADSYTAIDEGKVWVFEYTAP